jgi:hypothetical protein
VYIGLAGHSVDERAFNELQRLRAEEGGMTLQEFKEVLREQFFALLLDQDAALAAIPQMLPADPAERAQLLDAIRAVASAPGELTGERAERLRQIERLFAPDPEQKTPLGLAPVRPVGDDAVRRLPAKRKRS